MRQFVIQRMIKKVLRQVLKQTLFVVCFLMLYITARIYSQELGNSVTSYSSIERDSTSLPNSELVKIILEKPLGNTWKSKMKILEPIIDFGTLKQDSPRVFLFVTTEQDLICKVY